jgi:hypothetical protein
MSLQSFENAVYGLANWEYHTSTGNHTSTETAARSSRCIPSRWSRLLSCSLCPPSDLARHQQDSLSAILALSAILRHRETKRSPTCPDLPIHREHPTLRLHDPPTHLDRPSHLVRPTESRQETTIPVLQMPLPDPHPPLGQDGEKGTERIMES